MSIDSLAADFSAMRQAQVASAVSVSVAKMALDVAETVSSELIAALDPSGRGRMLDVRA